MHIKYYSVHKLDDKKNVKNNLNKVTVFTSPSKYSWRRFRLTPVFPCADSVHTCRRWMQPTSPSLNQFHPTSPLTHRLFNSTLGIKYKLYFPEMKFFFSNSSLRINSTFVRLGVSKRFICLPPPPSSTNYTFHLVKH